MLNEVKQKTKSNSTFVVVLGVVSLIFLALAAVLSFIHGFIELGFTSFSLPLFSLFQAIVWSLVGSILPIGLYIINKFTKKKIFPIIFIVVSILFVSVQLLAALLFLLLGLIPTHIFSPIISVFSMIVGFFRDTVSGSGLFFNTVYIINTFGVFDIAYLSSHISELLSDIFYILPNFLCLIGFIKLVLTKKPSNEAETVAAETDETVEAKIPAETNEIVETEAHEDVQPIIEDTVSVNESAKETCFCRKCGTELLSDSDFCHKCGTKAVR